MRKIFIAFFLSIFLSNLVSAADFGGIGGQPAEPDSNIPHSDQWFIYTLKPGESKDDALIVQNNSDEPVEILLYPADSTPSTDGGFALEQMVEPRDTVGAWITLSEERVKLLPRKIKTVPFRISIPQNSYLDVGEHTGGILIQKVQPETRESPQEGLQLLTRIGVRVYVTIPGEIIKKLELDQFEVELDEERKTYVVSFTLKNTGNVSQDIVIETKVMNEYPWLNWFFQGFPLKNERNFQILRDSSFTSHFEFPKPLFGKLKVESLATYDNDQKVLMPSSVTMAVPFDRNLMVLSVFIFALLAFSIALMVVKKYDKKKHR